MPPKPKLHKNTGKFSIAPPKLPQNSNEPSTSDTTESEQQFETELCWCIQQLQTALKSGKLNNKQIQDHTKSLNILMSNSSPLIRKRQVMRLSFGDYRAKMAAEDNKISKNALNMKVKPATPSKKSVFVKKSAFASSSGNTFRFNFETSSDGDDISNSISNVKIESEDNGCDSEIRTKNNDLKFVPSDNSFRFKFEVGDS